MPEYHDQDLSLHYSIICEWCGILNDGLISEMTDESDGEIHCSQCDQDFYPDHDTKETIKSAIAKLQKLLPD